MAVVISDWLLESSDRLLDGESDEHLVSLVRCGHEGAFAAVVRRYERELLGQARRLTADGRGEDAVQQAFLNAFAALQSGREVRHLRGWLHQILRNEVRRLHAPIDAPLEAATAYGEPLEDTVQRRATAHATLAELSALPERQRDALLGTAVFGLSRAHVARTMGLSEGAVRQLVHRARLRLRQAATALIPFPLVRFFGAARSGVDAAPDAALGAGTAVSGGLAIKIGALVASGVVATGIAVTHTFPTRHPAASAARGARHPGAHLRTPAQAPPVSAASVAPGDAVWMTSAARLREHGPAGVREDGRFRGGPGRRSGTRSGGHGGPGSGRGGTDGGREGFSPGRRDDGPGRSQGGTAGRGPNGDSSGSRSGSGSGSLSGSGSRSGSGSGSGSGGGSSGGSGSGGGHGSDAGTHSGSGGAVSGSGSTNEGLVTEGEHGTSGGSVSTGGSTSSGGRDARAATSAGSSDSPAAVTTNATSGDDAGPSSDGSSSSGGSSDGGSSGTD